MNSWSAGVTSVESSGGPDQVALVDLALDEARADHRDADPVRQQAPAQRVGQPVHRELRRRVDARARAGDERGHRGRVDDVPALPVRLDPRHEGDDAVDDAAEVDAEHPVPVLVRRVGDVVEEVDAGVVAEDVHVPEDALGLVGGTRERLAVGDVQLDRVHVAAELGRRRLEVVGADVGDRHRMPAARNALAMPSPTPLPPPVMKATLPSTSRMRRDLIVVRARGDGDDHGASRRRRAACCGPSICGRRGTRRSPARSTPASCARSRTSAVLEAIALQESAGIEAITDGEYRRHGWIALIPIIDDPLFQAPVSRLRVPRSGVRLARALEDGRGRAGRHLGAAARGAVRHPAARGRPRHRHGRVRVPEGERQRAREVHDPGAELAPHLLASRVLDRRVSRPRTTSSRDVARILREHVVDRLVELGCDYIQIDAPNYAQWHIDPENRAAFEAHGHDMAHELVADAEFDSMVFEGLTGVTRAMHMCRGNAPGGMWAATGGYEAISKQVFPRLKNIDRLLLEYDSDRAGTFAPLADVLPSHEVVLGLVTTKDGTLEDPDELVARVEEATRVRAARTAGDQPAVRLRVGRDRRDDRRRAGGEAAADRRRRATDLGLVTAPELVAEHRRGAASATPERRLRSRRFHPTRDAPRHSRSRRPARPPSDFRSCLKTT